MDKSDQKEKAKKAAKKETKPKKEKKNGSPSLDVSDISVDFPSDAEMMKMTVAKLREFASQFDVTGKSKVVIIAKLRVKWDEMKVDEEPEEKPRAKPKKKAPTKAPKRAAKSKLPSKLEGHFEVVPISKNRDGFKCLHCDSDAEPIKSKSGASSHLKKEHPAEIAA